MELDALLAGVAPPDTGAYEDCIHVFDSIAKPVGSLGALEDLTARMAAIYGDADFSINKKAVLVFCADNGVVAKGVTQAGNEVTAAIAGMLRDKTACVTRMAGVCGADAHIIDIGMVNTVEGLLDRSLMRGTNDISEEPAMTRETAVKAIHIGIEQVRLLKAAGCGLVATGEAGIGNTTSSSAMACVLLGVDAERVTGRGAGLDDAGLARKREIVKLAVKINDPNPDDPLDVLSKVGGLDIAAMTGVFLGGAIYRIPVVMDGFISSVAALTAVRMCAHALGCILPSHLSGEPGMEYVVRELGLSPVLHAGMRLGEGTGAVALFPLLDMAYAVYRGGARFSDIAVDQYKRLP